jgi:hypothetical protein
MIRSRERLPLLCRREKIMRRAGLLLWLLAGFGLGGPVRALAADEPVATRHALAVDFGKSYSPSNDRDFLLLSAAALFDYDRVWPHRAPEALRFKVEGSAGLSAAPRVRAVVSGNVLALYYLDGWATSGWRPYAEAGIGLIYTDFQEEGQGLRINFNPQAGLGVEFGGENEAPPWFAAIRLHHLSNGELHRDNRGVNSLLVRIGKFF